MDISVFFQANQALDESAIEKAYVHQQSQDKPEAALGKLDEAVFRLANLQGIATPAVEKPYVAVFAGDHGVAEQGVSAQVRWASSSKLTRLANKQGAIDLLALQQVFSVDLFNCGIFQENTDCDRSTFSSVCTPIAAGTQDFTVQPAMTEQQILRSMLIGFAAAERAYSQNADIFIAGELGVGNTASASAIGAFLSGQPVADWVGDGSGIGFAQRKTKVAFIEQALRYHQAELTSPLKALQILGGFEIAALCGAYIRCAQLGLPILVDGFVCSIAVWVADLISRNDQLVNCQSEDAFWKLGKCSLPETMFCTCGSCPRLVDWCFFSHQSSEPGHERLLEILAVEPLLNLEMSLGEGSAAILALPLLRSACALHVNFAKSDG